jgi:hypothetical protein
MATQESDKVDRALRGKMKAERLDSVDWRYVIYNEQGKQIASTRISKGAKHTLRAGRLSLMARQLGLDTSQQFVDLVSCKLDREDAVRIIEANGLS